MTVHIEIHPHVVAARRRDYRPPITEIWLKASAEADRPVTTFRCADTPEARGKLLTWIRTWAEQHRVTLANWAAAERQA